MAAIITPKKAFVTVGSANADYILDATNPHTTINNAITAVNAAGGGIVHLKAGTYTFPNSATGYVLMKSNVSLEGDGINKTILVGGTTELSNNSTSVGVITTAAQSGAGASTTKTTHLNMAVKNMTIKPYNGGYGITCFNVTGLDIEGVETFTPTGSPTLVKAGIYVRFGANVWVNKCYVHDTHGNGININGVDYFAVTDNIVKNIYDDGIDIDLDYGDTDAVYSQYGTVKGNVVEGVAYNGNCIRIENSHYVTVTNNVVSAGTPSNGAGDGIWVGCYNVANKTCTNVVVANNHIRDCATVGIHTECTGNASGATVANIIIANNNIYNCGVNAGTDVRGGIVHAAPVASGKKVKIFGNNIDTVAKTSDSGGIVIYKQGRVEVTNNIVVNAPYAIHLWNGSGSETYTDVFIANNNVSGTTASYFTSSAAFNQSGVTLVASGQTTPDSTSVADFRKHTAAGRVNFDIANTAASDAANKVRIRMAPFSGFVGSDLHPYIEAIVENAGTGQSGIRVGAYTGSAIEEKMQITGLGNIVLGKTSALAINATDGFMYIPSGAGAPTGTPTAYTGKVPMYYDMTNNHLYVYNSSWKKTTVFA